MENSKFYYIRSKRMAVAIEFITKLPYMIFDDRDNPEIKKYAFENTEEFQKALSNINSLRKQYH